MQRNTLDKKKKKVLCSYIAMYDKKNIYIFIFLNILFFQD